MIMAIKRGKTPIVTFQASHEQFEKLKILAGQDGTISDVLRRMIDAVQVREVEVTIKRIEPVLDGFYYDVNATQGVGVQA